MTTELVAFSDELLSGERLEWTGRPDTSIIFHREDWWAIPFSLFWGGFAIFWLLLASGVGNSPSHHPDSGFEWAAVIWGTPFVLVGQYMIWGRFLYSYWLKGRTHYGLTNKRALIIQNGLRGRSSEGVYFEGLTMIDKYARSDGKGSISFGGPYRGVLQLGHRSNPPRAFTFDDLEDVASVYKMALRLRDQSSK